MGSCSSNLKKGATSDAVNALFDIGGDQCDAGDFLVVRVAAEGDDKLLDDVIGVLQREMCGTTAQAPDTVLDWVYCNRGDGVGEPLPAAPSERRLAYFRWTAAFCVHFCLPRGGVYALQDKASGAVVAACATVPPGGMTLAGVSICEYMRASGKAGGMEAPKDDADGGAAARDAALFKAMGAAHKRVVPGNDNLHVLVFGVDPARQGQGVGTALLNFVARVADADGVPAWLESAGARSEHFYGKIGFAVGERFPVAAKKGAKGTFDYAGGVMGMVRRAGAPGPASGGGGGGASAQVVPAEG